MTFFAKVKGIFTAFLVVLGVLVTLALTYFITVFGGIILLLVLLYFLSVSFFAAKENGDSK